MNDLQSRLKDANQRLSEADAGRRAAANMNHAEGEAATIARKIQSSRDVLTGERFFAAITGGNS